MGDISLNLGVGFQLGLLAIFLIGFIPGFYISFLLLSKTRPLTIVNLIIPFIIGVFIGIVTFYPVTTIIILIFSSNYVFSSIILLLLPLIELFGIFMHYYYLRHRKQKKS